MRIIIAGGGTGGHLYPGLAVAEVLRAEGAEVLFVGTARGIEARAVPAAGFPLELLQVSGLVRMGWQQTMRGLGKLPGAGRASLRLVRRFRPDVVLGVGGYASGPLVLAAALARVPTALQEQNSVPGRTNRWLGRFARRVFLGFEAAAPYFRPGRCVTTGNPVRASFLASAHARAESASDGRLRLLVVGGSQGARAVNELVVGAVPLLVSRGLDLAVVHQAGAADAERVTAAYAAAGLTSVVEVRPFIEDMATAYHRADLVVGRAGALTLAELAVVGRPALLIPLPTAAHDHQAHNAAAFAAAGAAVIMAQATATSASLAEALHALLVDGERRSAMARAMAALARPDAARAVAAGLRALAERTR